VLGVERREDFSGGPRPFREGLWPAFWRDREGRKEKAAEAELSRGGLPRKLQESGLAILSSFAFAGVFQHIKGDSRQGAQNHTEREFVNEETDQEAYAEAEHQAYREGTSPWGRVVFRTFRHERLLLGRLKIFFPPRSLAHQPLFWGDDLLKSSFL